MESYEIRIADASGAVQLVVRRSDPLQEITPEMFEAEVTRLLASVPEDGRRPARLALHEAGVPDHPPVFGPNTMSRYPPVTGIVFDRLGNLWVLEYPGPSAASTRWSVFDSTGVWMGDVAFPAGVTPLDIGPDYVLAHWRDELDVEYVGVFDLIKP